MYNSSSFDLNSVVGAAVGALLPIVIDFCYTKCASERAFVFSWNIYSAKSAYAFGFEQANDEEKHSEQHAVRQFGKSPSVCSFCVHM